MNYTDSQFYNALAASDTRKLESHNDYSLFHFQQEGVEWLTRSRTNGKGFTAPPLIGLLGDEMGLGKTAQALSAIMPLVQSGKRFILIVPGATIIQWQKNWDRWILDFKQDEFGTDGLFRIRSATARIPNGVSVVMSHAMMARPDIIRALAALNFDGLLIDEIHKFGSINVPWGNIRKAAPAKRTTHLWALRNLTESHFESARIGLSGTPVRNYAREAYNILHLLDPEKFRNFEDFARRYLSYDTKSLHNPRQFHDDIAPYYLRRTVSEVQKDLPACRRTKLYTEVTDPLIAMAYNKELNLMANFLENSHTVATYNEDGSERPQSLLGYLIRLRHITGIAKAKEPSIIEPIRDYLDETDDNGHSLNNKVVIGIHHQFVYDRLRKSFPSYTIFLIKGGMNDSEKEHTKLSFINHKGPAILMLSIKAGGEGIDGLQLAACKSYVFERQWNAADEEQFVKRLHRTGQTRPVSCEWTMALGTVDEFFDEMVEQKRKISNDVENLNWEYDGTAMRQLAERCISSPLKVSKLTQEDLDLMREMGIEGDPA